MHLYSILTTETNAGGGVLGLLPVILLGICGVILLIALIVGWKKGARRVKWTGIVWLLTSLAFCLLQGMLSGVFAGLFGGVIPNLVAKFPFDEVAQGNIVEGMMMFLPPFAVAIACILVAMILYGICTVAFRPKIKYIRKNADSYTLDEDGIEYDEDYEDYDDYEDYTTRKMPVRVNCQTPGFAGRLIGALLCFINTFMVIATVLVLGLFLLNATALKEGALSFLYSYQLGGFAVVPVLVMFAENYALDIFFIGILVAFVCKGRKNGFMETLRGLLKFVGLVVVILCFYLPFSAKAVEPTNGGNYFLWALTSRCVETVVKILGTAKISSFAPIIGKILSGLLLAITATVVFVLINWILNKLVAWIQRHAFTRTVDGLLAGLMYLIVGIVVCLVVWAVWYLLARYGIFKVDELFSKGATLSHGLFKTLGTIIEPMLLHIDQMLGVLPA